MRYAFSKRVRHLQSSAVRDILKVVGNGDVISFAGGLPADDLFPVEAIEEAFSRAFASGTKALQYIETEGYRPLRELVVERMKRKEITGFTGDDVLLTTGSQQAIDLFSRVMFSPGDIVLTEDPTYLAALQVFQSYEADIVAVDSDSEGMLQEDLEAKMRTLRPKCVYVVPTFSNPAGKVWSLERRKMLVRLAHKYNCLILEDDPYGDIQFNSEETYTPMAALDDGSRVMYTSTFSKTAVPALRTGWIVGPYQVIRMMAQAKQANDLHSNSLSQQAIYQLCTHFDFDGHIKGVTDLYRRRRDVMMNCLQHSNLPNVHFIEPKGGMFLWIELDEKVNTTAMLTEAVTKGVAYVPGAPFYAGVPKHNTMRLNFTHATDEEIERGMGLLAEVFTRTDDRVTTVI
ncbi:PLP-dependent aminotransferase family protein [Alkalicoccobacillus porphyridii]|uniref:PLP-dependent aminotransferase family protein n=1 Tax=Alkalicoccobacillus porphyridii TaxID=2597270 RepID=A0A553ZWG5_9BACI|nr:PLP-dependent aminotransferase family protein [Alkalicoccobacillus porphyridii]TSB45809.1 PLP-dependent aminotransferase family protein [Alkalicoccobacillus porphyridii]